MSQCGKATVRCWSGIVLLPLGSVWTSAPLLGYRLTAANERPHLADAARPFGAFII